MSVKLEEQTEVSDTLRVATEHLLSLQRADGSWWGVLRTNVTMEAEYVLLMHCLDKRDARREQKLRRWILSQQATDGGWAVYPGGPSDVSVTVEAVQALRIIGVDDDACIRRAREFVLAHGGIQATRVFTRLWLALLGQYPWRDLPVVPPEIIFLPDSFPLNLYDFACWARQTVVPLSIVIAHRPVYPLPSRCGVRDLFIPGPTAAPKTRRHARQRALVRIFQIVDGALKLYQAQPCHPGRKIAERRAIDWVVQRQEADGSWGGIQPPWFYSLLALDVCGLKDSEAFAKGCDGLESFGVDSADVWWFQACISPVWDTALAVAALRSAGFAPDHPALVRAAQWLLARQVTVEGDWKHGRPQAEPGGWPFELYNDNYPDVDDTAVVLYALSQVRVPDEDARKRALTSGFRWLRAMQSKNGGWAAFDADQTRTFAALIPFSDFGWVLDPPTEDVTGHALECFGAFGYDTAWDVVSRGIAFLKAAQRPDGAFFGRWGVNCVYGIGMVLPGLAAVGVDMNEEWVVRAVNWLRAHQNPDGGWGETCASYADEALCGQGESTPSQTAWGLLALVAAGCADGPEATRAVQYLQYTQQADGQWLEERYTGTGFPGDFMIGYDMYRLVFPVMALGRYRKAQVGRALAMDRK
jgi:squalene-hopene/tetraprenyl-beta-curcumene cyclase